MKLYDRIVDKNLLVRRINISANHLMKEGLSIESKNIEQIDLFTNYEELQKKQEKEKLALEHERNIQKTILSIKKKFGKNSILKGINLEEGATAKNRNSQIGGHNA